jgi:DNA mismatch repair protein MutS2
MIEYRLAAEKLDFAKIIYRLQSYASSELGRSAAEEILPSTDLPTISQELNRVTEMKSILEGEDAFFIDGLKDIRDPLQRSRVENNILTASELLHIASTLKATQNIKSFIGKRREACPELQVLVDKLSTDKVLEYNILLAIDEKGSLRDNASKELKMVRADLVKMQDMLRSRLERILQRVSEQGAAQEEIITTRDGRMVIPVKVEEKHKVPGFIHSSSATGLTVFIEPAETLSLNNEIQELHFREQREVKKILRELTAQVRESSEELLETLTILSAVDLIYAKARYSVEIKGNKPFLKENGSVKIFDGRHPILLLRHKPELIVPLNLNIGDQFTTLLITGPNSGGKSVAMKTVGILVLMVQSGIHIPASPESEFPIFTKLFVDIGDSQSIENDLSTFSSHVVRLKEITDGADEHSLVLLDEVGGGTDPAEGGALAAAVLKFLTNKGTCTIATSHQLSLKAFVYESPGMENGAMEFDQKSLLPTYQFRTGVPGSSYALEIAERFGLNGEIISQAKDFVGEKQDRLEKLVAELESRSQSLQLLLNKTDADKLKYNKLIEEYQSKIKQLNKEIVEIKSRAVEEASMIVAKAHSIIENSVREIRTKQANSESIRQSKSRIQQLSSDIHLLSQEFKTTEPDENTDTVPSFKEGSIVKLKSGGEIGEVIREADGNGILTVAFNAIKMKVQADELAPIQTESRQHLINISSSIQKEIKREIDLRGMYGDDAIKAVDKFLDDSILSGAMHIDIIHGKGTGALRKRVAEYLKSDNRIKSFHLGEWNEGGSGVTVIDLKD